MEKKRKRKKHGISTMKCTENNSLLLYTYSNDEDPQSIKYRREQLYITARLCFVQVIHAGPVHRSQVFTIPMTEEEAGSWISAHVPGTDGPEAVKRINEIADKIKANYTIHRYLYEKLMTYCKENRLKASHIIEIALMRFFEYDKCSGLLDNEEVWKK